VSLGFLRKAKVRIINLGGGLTGWSPHKYLIYTCQNQVKGEYDASLVTVIPGCLVDVTMQHTHTHKNSFKLVTITTFINGLQEIHLQILSSNIQWRWSPLSQSQKSSLNI
jgi:hypothetical protein